jgi:hypothetical protein
MNRVILLLPLFLLGCEASQRQSPRPGHPSENHVPGRLDFGAFTLKVPKGWTQFAKEGIDSYIGGFTNGKDTLQFEYGDYRDKLSDDGIPSRLYASDTIDGFPAIVSIPKEDKRGLVEMLIGDEDAQKLYIGGYTSDIPAALAIFESVHISTGDPTKTHPLTPDRFCPGRPPSATEGYSLFRANCSSCHNKYKVIIGPALLPDYIKQKGEKWLTNWLGHDPVVPNDSNQMYCLRAPLMDKQQLASLVNYLKASPRTYSIAEPQN